MAEDNGHGSDAEERKLHRWKRKKCLIYTLLLFKTGIILLLAATVKRTQSPKFRVRSAEFGAFSYSSAAANPSFDITLYAELGVKNTNFGRYKFDSTTVQFYYNGAVVGSVVVPGWSARARSTRVIRVQVELSSAGLADRVQLRRDLEAGVLPLNSRAELKGEVEALQVFKRNKKAEMECFLAISLMQRSVGYLSCQ